VTWKTRLKTEILLDSPDGDSFSALWIGNPRSFEKRLGFFDYPKVDGTRIQDLGSGAITYPLTIYFEGDDNDIEANRFLNSCKQVGLWSIDHPVRGKLELQLVAVTENIAPIESGNVTTIETEWIEPIKDQIEKSLEQKKATIAAGVDDVNETATSQLTNLVEQAKATQVYTFAVSAQKVVTTVKERLENLYEKSAAIKSQIDQVQRSITNTLNQTVIDVAGLAGEIQTLVQLPTQISDDISARLSFYGDMVDDLLGLSPEGITAEDKNAAAIQEAALVASIGAMAQISASGTLRTRTQAIDTVIKIDGLFSDIVTELDTIQSTFVANYIDNQFFSQSSSYSDSSLLVARILDYLLEASYDLAVEKKILLKRPRAPIEITISEYGELGPDDAFFDLFIASNNLKGSDILLLPAGREVVIYV